jgi:hypothetical protein
MMRLICQEWWMQQIRGCSARLKNKLNNVCHVMGIVKSGSVNTLIATAKSNMEKLTATDAKVFGVAPMMLATTTLMKD